MTEPEKASPPVVSVEEIQQGWNELKLQVAQATEERTALEAENKALRFLVDRLIEHRQRSHGELVNVLVEMVGRLPVNDVGLLVTRLVDHNTEVCEVCATLLKGKADEALPKPSLLKDIEEKKHALKNSVKLAVEKLLQLDTPLEKEMIESLTDHPELFFTSKFVRANRCFVKGQVPRERVLRVFGEEALSLFNDLTTDKRFNPRPKPDEIVLGFKDDFEQLLESDTSLAPEKKEALRTLFQKVQSSRADSAEGCEQKQAFAWLSFLLELLRYYENPNTEAPDAVFAQRLPAAVEQLSGVERAGEIDEETVGRIEELLAFIIKPDHRHMVVNNVGKGGGAARTLKHVLILREEIVVDLEHALSEFVRHVIPPTSQPAPKREALVRVLKLIPSNMQRLLVGSIMSSDRRRREELTRLGRDIAKELDLKGLEEAAKTNANVSPETERRMAWDEVKSRIRKREDAASVAAAIRERLHTKYDVDEVKESWLTLIEADPIAFIRIFCQLPYLASGKTDPIAHAVMQVYVGRLLHEKYGAFYHKVLTSLKNMFKANPHSSTLNNFLAMVRWADADAVKQLSEDVGMAAPA